jgi:PAS domain S-box-containing protein
MPLDRTVEALEREVEALQRELRELKEAKSARKRVDSLRDQLMLILCETSLLIVVTDANGRIVFANPSGRRVLGLGPGEDPSGTPMISLLTQESQERVQEDGWPALAQRGEWHGEITLCSPLGREIPMLVELQAHKREDGGVSHYSGVGRDITDRKRMEDALRESEERARHIVKHCPNAMAVLDRDMRFIMVSDRFLEDYGFGEMDIVGMHNYDVLPEVPDRWREVHRRCLEGSVERSDEDMIVRPDGSVEYERWECRPWWTASGEIGGVVLYTEVITQRKKSVEAMAWLAAIVENSEDAIIGTDSEDMISSWNGGAERMYGHTAQEVVGKPMYIIVPPDGREAFLQVRRRLRSGEAIKRFETVRMRKDGSLVEIATSVCPMRDASGKVMGTAGIGRDISARKQMEQQLLRAQRLEAAGRVAGQVAHDFNNLLGPLVAYPELIKMRLPQGHPALDYCDEMVKAAQQMAEINSDMLVLSRRGLLRQEPVDLNDLVEQALDTMAQTLEGLRLEIQLEAAPSTVSGSSAQLLRVVSNLIANARDASSAGGVVTMRTDNVYVDSCLGTYDRIEMGEYVRLTVKDSGSGIPPEIKDKIFDPFFSTKGADQRRGSGLGLAIVQAVVGDHSGFIDLESEPGMGSTFLIYLPFHRDIAAMPTSGRIVNGTESILVVDDDPFQRRVLISLLESLGYGAEAVSSGEAAIDYLKDHSVDLLLLDMIMPGGIDGAETYRQITQARPAQRAIVVSGFAETERVQLAQSLGAGQCIRKPVSLDGLSMAVREELDRGR